MATIDHSRNVRYFKPTSLRGGIVLGVLGFLALFPGSTTVRVIGVALIAVGALLIVRQTVGRPKDEEIDEQVRSVMSELPARALDKLGLAQQEVSLTRPIIVGGYDLRSSGQVKRGKDGMYRGSSFEGVAIFFGEQELHAYKYRISLVKESVSDRTDVYFYRDVVSVSTQSSSDSKAVIGETKPQVVTSDVLTLTTSGGTAVDCSMDAVGVSRSNDIQAARQLIRDKKLHAM